MLEHWEYQEYTLAHYNGAILTLRHLRDALEKWAITQDTSWLTHRVPLLLCPEHPQLRRMESGAEARALHALARLFRG